MLSRLSVIFLVSLMSSNLNSPSSNPSSSSSISGINSSSVYALNLSVVSCVNWATFSDCASISSFILLNLSVSVWFPMRTPAIPAINPIIPPTTAPVTLPISAPIAAPVQIDPPIHIAPSSKPNMLFRLIVFIYFSIPTLTVIKSVNTSFMASGSSSSNDLTFKSSFSTSLSILLYTFCRSSTPLSLVMPSIPVNAANASYSSISKPFRSPESASSSVPSVSSLSSTSTKSSSSVETSLDLYCETSSFCSSTVSASFTLL